MQAALFAGPEVAPWSLLTGSLPGCRMRSAPVLVQALKCRPSRAAACNPAAAYFRADCVGALQVVAGQRTETFKKHLMPAVRSFCVPCFLTVLATAAMQYQLSWTAAASCTLQAWCEI